MHGSLGAVNCAIKVRRRSDNACQTGIQVWLFSLAARVVIEEFGYPNRVGIIKQ